MIESLKILRQTWKKPLLSKFPALKDQKGPLVYYTPLRKRSRNREEESRGRSEGGTRCQVEVEILTERHRLHLQTENNSPADLSCPTSRGRRRRTAWKSSATSSWNRQHREWDQHQRSDTTLG
eukprot:761149-Hanusia_phi.AAC.1